MVSVPEQVNTEDALLLVAHLLGIVSLFGVLTVSTVHFDFQMADVVTEVGGIEVTAAAIAAVGSLGVAYLLNDSSWDDYTDNEQYFLLGTVALHVLVIVSDEAQEFVTTSEFASLAAAGVALVGYIVVAQLE